MFEDWLKSAIRGALTETAKTAVNASGLTPDELKILVTQVAALANETSPLVTSASLRDAYKLATREGLPNDLRRAALLKLAVVAIQRAREFK